MQKFEDKLIRQKLIDPGEALMGDWDAGLAWNRPDPTIRILAPLFEHLNISTVLFSRPAEPYRTMVSYLASRAEGVIRLKDNETRLFLHDIPVLETFSSETVIAGLKRRKCVIVPGGGILTCGAVSPEQTFVNFSSVLFSCFVKFFSDYLANIHRNAVGKNEREVFERVRSFLPEFPDVDVAFAKGPFSSPESAYEAVCEAGKPLVNYGFVDSVMGNISCVTHSNVYISQTGSFLDELEGCVDACPMDNSTCAGLTASSELPTHMAVYRNSDLVAVVHGHPRFSVILSLFCEKQSDCPHSDNCQTRCPEKRYVGNVPIVIGESGSGPLSISRTVPSALAAVRGVIVYGHGIFTAGEKDFNDPFKQLCAIEKMCRERYFDILERTG